MKPKNKTNKLRVCYFGTYRANYGRNYLMIYRLRSQGISVIECHSTLWKGITDRVQIASGGWRNPRFWWRVFSAYAQLLWKYSQIGDYDLMIVGYPGQPDVPLARILTWLNRKPLAWDIMMSIYLITLERGLDDYSQFTSKLIFWLEKFACNLPDWLIVDTIEYANWYNSTYGISRDKIRFVPLGADDRIFQPTTFITEGKNELICLYYGTFIPNHGVQHILEAARELRDEPFRFLLIGDGPLRSELITQAERDRLNNVSFIPWVSQKHLVHYISHADICLGTFGETPQALMTVQHKIFETMAMGRPMINGDSPAMHTFLENNNFIWLCPRSDGIALASAIRTVGDNPQLRKHLGKSAKAIYQEHFSIERTAQLLAGYIREFTKLKDKVN